MKDMPNLSLQYGAYPLALAYRFFEEPFRGNPALLRMTEWALDFWCSRQGREGAFDQLMPHECSVGTTFYTLGAVLESRRILEDGLTPGLRARLEQAVDRAGAFLLKNEESYGVIANHIALFAWVFDLLHRDTGRDEFRVARDREIGKVLASLHRQEGWFLEYNGADPGYQTQTLHYLALLCPRVPALEAVVRNSFCSFLQYFFHPDGTFGGCYGARSNRIVYPGAIIHLATGGVPEGIAALRWLSDAMAAGALPEPGTMDDENVLRTSGAWLASFYEDRREIGASSPTKLPCHRGDIRQSFPDAGLEIFGSEQAYVVVGARKGGAYVATDKKSGHSREDAGYVARLARGSASTQVQQQPLVRRTDTELEIEAQLFHVPAELPTPMLTVLLRLLNVTLLRFRALRDAFKRLLARWMVTGNRPSGMVLHRRITFAGTELQVRDTISSTPGRPRVQALWSGGSYSAVTMAAADLASIRMLTNDPPEELAADKLSEEGSLTLERRITFA
jgi:hypothetical protein